MLIVRGDTADAVALLEELVQDPWWPGFGRIAAEVELARLTSSSDEVEEARRTFDRDRLIQVAREIMTSARYCALVTLDAGGAPHVRAMDPFEPDEAMVVWLATRPSTRKVEEIRGNDRVALYYFDADSQGYVTLTGSARLVDDPGEKARRWKEEWAAFYPDRALDYLLVQVIPDRVEVVSVAHGIEGGQTDWRPPTVIFGDAS
jgi:general stress protein 26